MATIRKRGTGWQAQVRRKGTTLSRTFIQRQDAQRWANQTELEADQKGFQTDRKVLDRTTTADLLKRFRDEVVPIRRCPIKETFMINSLLRSGWVDKPLSDLTSEDIASHRDRRTAIVRPGTVIRELGLLQHILEVARVEWSIPLNQNPVRAIRKPKADRPRERRLQTGEFDRILDALNGSRNPQLKPLILFALETGMRRGELLNAIWGDVNWTDSTLRIPITKNGEPRTIPLTKKARYILADLSFDFWDRARIFPMTGEAVKLGWKRLTTRASIPDIHFHDLRHEAVSRFFELGLTVPEVALISGHKDPRMLFRYTHLRAEDLARKVNSVIG